MLLADLTEAQRRALLALIDAAEEAEAVCLACNAHPIVAYLSDSIGEVRRAFDVPVVE